MKTIVIALFALVSVAACTEFDNAIKEAGSLPDPMCQSVQPDASNSYCCGWCPQPGGGMWCCRTCN